MALGLMRPLSNINIQGLIEGAPKDQFVISNEGRYALPKSELIVDLGGSAAGLIFDVNGDGAGVEVFQPFALLARAGALNGVPKVGDGDTRVSLSIRSLAPRAQIWVLSSSYKLTRSQITQVLDVLLRSKQLLVDQAEHVVRALRAYSAGTANFADCMIERTASAAGCSKTMTFDGAAAKTAGMTLIQ